MKRALVFFVVLALALVAWTAFAQEARRAGHVRLEVAPGVHGPLDLRPAKDGFAGELSIVNDGKEPLVVSRIAVRGDATDPRSPPRLNAHLAEGSLPATILPGASRKAAIEWFPERGIRQRQLFAHVVVTTSDEQSGEVAMGVRAQLYSDFGWLEGRVLSLLIGAPLLGAVLTFLVRLLKGADADRLPRLVALVFLGIQAALAVYVYRGFAPDVSRLDGNDGIQFIEHAVWIRAISAELFLGVDGVCAGPLLVTSLVALVGMLAEPRRERGAPGYHAAYLALSASTAGALCSMDALLFCVFTSAAVVAASLIVGGWGGPDRRRAATRLALFGTVAVVLLLVVILTCARNADPTFLVDGTKTNTTFSLPELSRVALGAKGAKLFGGSLPRVAFALVLIASLVLLGAFPLHGWLAPTLLEARTATGALTIAALPAIGTCALLRLGCGVLPEGVRWASGVVVALGAVTAAYGALSALGQMDLRRLAASAAMSQVGFALLGVGSLTPQGISGAIVLASTRALACALFLLLAGAVDDRVHTRDVGKLSGVATQMPGWAIALAIAALGQAGVVGLGGAWGPILALFGALPNYAPLAVVAAVALVVSAAAHLGALSRVVFGKLDVEWIESPLLKPFGGRFPDLTTREWLAVAPVATLVALLGLWPAPLLAATSGTVRDLTNAVSPPGPEQIALVDELSSRG
ncbi:MAG TPA: NADH-quinone oxidoreductase subunit M [Labilithrix sp.]